MSLLHRPRAVRLPPPPSAADPLAGRSLTFRWSISRAALRAVGVPADGPGDAALAVTIDADGASASLDGRDHPIPGGAVVTLQAESGLLHIDCRDVRGGTLLAATVRLAPDDAASTAHVLYVRTGLLATLGLPGGRYEVAGVGVSPALASSA